MAVIYGTPARSVEDVVQETLIGAWLSVERGRYRPDPATPPDVALWRWVRGIAFRQARTAAGKAHRRREVRGLAGLDGLDDDDGGGREGRIDPLVVAVLHDGEAQLDARRALLAWAHSEVSGEPAQQSERRGTRRRSARPASHAHAGATVRVSGGRR